MRIALYQPDIAGNVGAVLRTAACLAVPCDIIEPCGFAFSERALKRSGMDYAAQADIRRHADWASFLASLKKERIVLMSSKASTPLPRFTFRPDDVILMGSESSGAPVEVHERADARVYIPMAPGFRSLNISVSAGIALAEGLRQTQQFPGVTM
ncbi:MAG: tRNA (cytidine(34)-2'-O)-methyltransferase [Sphingomonadaceae bacterium]|nr:tRNA (cytidine(34)-2'-O)-methyltransferase [Sphingomonadaceae bacterium]